jgi:hypoxanthine phosphoribosyltransferase
LPEPSDAAARPEAFTAGTGEHIEVLYSAERIRQRVEAMAADIAGAGFERLLVVPILTGSFIFAADLIRALHDARIMPEVDFLSLGSYGSGTSSSGAIQVLRDLEVDATGRHCLLLDDILDTGRTLAFAKDLLAARGAARVECCVLLDKRARRAVAVEADYRGFDCPDAFVVGYGMDLAHRFRELPFVGRIM